MIQASPLAVFHYAGARLPRLRQLLCFSGLLLLSSLPTISQAQITLDGSLGPRGALTGPNYVIPAALGQIRGPNLFHSFDQFNLRPFRGESATFTGPNTIANILSRVTGGSPSIIDERLRSAIPGANLFLINPSGVVFGPNASLDVSGSFHVSTADYMRLADGARFSAHLSETSTLSVAPPAAFGFLGPTPARIDILGSTLEVSTGQTLSVVGGDIGITSFLSTPQLSAPGGRIHLVSVASAGEVIPHPTDPAMPLQVDSFPRLGQITLSGSTLLDASGSSGGTVVIRGGRLLLDNANVFADTQGNSNGAAIGIDIDVKGEVILTHGSSVTTDVLGGGNAGAIQILADSLDMSNTSTIGSRAFPGTTGARGNLAITTRRMQMTDGSQISSATAGTGPGGTITVTVADTVSLASGAVISSSTFGAGRGGAVTVQANTLQLVGAGTGIASQSRLGSTGDAGDLIVGSSAITLTEGAQINTSTFGPGAAGTIILTATRELEIQGQGTTGSPSGLFSNTSGGGTAGRLTVSAPSLMLNGGAMGAGANAGSTGNAGTILVQADRFRLSAEAQLSSNTAGAGAAGTVVIRADTLLLDGAKTAIGAQSLPGSAGNAGNVTVTGRAIALTGGAFLTSGTFGSGTAGMVTVHADTLMLDGIGTLITAQTGGTGNAGNVTVTGRAITLTGGAQIDSSTFGPGNGGAVTVQAETLRMDGVNNGRRTLIASQSNPGSTGDAGNVTVTGTTIVLTGGAQITSGTFGPGRSGLVTVRANTLSLDGVLTAIASQTEEGSTGDAGNVTVTGGAITLTGGALISSSTSGAGRGGTVTVQADTLHLDGAKTGIASQSNHDSTGDAGNVILEGNAITLTGGVQILSNTFGPGHGGTITIHADTLSLDGVNTGIASQAETGSTGEAGNVMVQGTAITLTGNAQISSSTSGPGRGGTVTVNAMQVLEMRGRGAQKTPSGLFSTTFGAGAGGNVVVTAPTVTMDDSLIQAGATATGAAGTIVVSAGTLILTGGALIDSRTLDQGPGGLVLVTATDTVRIAGRNRDGQASGLVSLTSGKVAGAGDAGVVLLAAPQVQLADGGQMQTSTQGAGNAGMIVVGAFERDVGGLTLRGPQVVQVTLTGGAEITSSALASSRGNGGQVLVMATALALDDTARIAAITAGTGAAGNVVIGDLGQARALLASLYGAGGAVTLRSDPMVRLTLTGGAQITSSSGLLDATGTVVGGMGRGGAVTATITDALVIAGQDTTGTMPSGIFSQTLGIGDAGRIAISTPRLSLADGGRIGADTGGDGRGGDVTVQVGTVTLSGGAQINSRSGIEAGNTRRVGTGPGGTVAVTATDIVTVAGQGSGIATTTAGQGAGGDMTLQARAITLSDGAILTAETRGTGTAGTITLNVENLVAMEQATITSSSTGTATGNAGTVTIRGLDGTGTAASTVTFTGSTLQTTAEGTGAGGAITVVAGEALRLDHATLSATVNNGLDRPGGPRGDVTLTAPSLTMVGGSLAAETTGTRKAGNIALQVGSLTATDQAQITSSSTGQAPGAAGTVTIRGPDGSGTAVRTVTLTESTLRTTAEGTGAGGAITVAASESLRLDHTTLSATVNNGTDTPGGARGDITLTTPILTVTGGGLTAETTGTRSAGDITLNLGSLLAQEATLSSSSTGSATGNAGTVTIQGLGGPGTVASTVTLTDSSLLTRADGAGTGGSLQLDATTVTLAGTTLSATTTGAGNAGAITLAEADTLHSTNSRLTTEATAGAGGAITVAARTALDLTGTTVSARVLGGAQAGGTVTLRAPTVALTGGALQATTAGAGRGGDVVVEAGTLTLTGRARLDSSTSGAGSGGTVTVTAMDEVTITGQQSGLFTNTVGSGPGGNLTLEARTLQLNAGARVSAESTGTGNAGGVVITVTDAFRSTDSAVTTAATAGAAGGDITIAVRGLVELRASDITASVAGGMGPGGDVTLTAPTLRMEGGTIRATTAGAGAGGTIQADVGRLALTAGVQIDSSSSGPGQGGQVTITATDAVLLSGQGSGLFTRSAGSGQGGNITLQAPRVALTDHATISAESTGLGNAGNISIAATREPFLIINGTIVTRATQADGGNIQITTPTMLRLRNSTITAEVGGGASTVGGNITIDPQFVLLQNSQIVANARAGRGGNIDIVAHQVFLADPESLVSASSALGINGQVDIRAPVTSISGAVAPPSPSFAQAGELLRNRCAERLREGTVSRFVVGGRDGVPLEPGQLLLSPLELGDQGIDSRVEGLGRHHAAETQRQGWYAQAQALWRLDGECARWRGQHDSTLPTKPIR
jgi:filamentous hemagglutinin family protein